MFRLSPTLSAADREAFVRSIEHAFTGVPSIRTVTVGRRILLGAGYESKMESYDFMATLEFATEADLRGYLEHPAHVELGTRFFGSVDAALVYDFATVPGSRLRELAH